MKADCRRWRIALLAALMLAETAFGAPSSTPPAAQLCKCNAPYRAIGVNYFDGIYRRIRMPRDQSYLKGLDTLARYGIPFVRASFTGHWPNEFRLYLDKPELYFKLIDEFLDACEARNIGVVASVFWNQAAIPDVVQEPITAWGDPSSKTVALATQLTKDLVARYGKREVIWAWEYGNEPMMKVDLPNAERLRPAVNVSQGTPALRTSRDDLSAQDMLRAFQFFGQAVNKVEPAALLSSGNAAPRPFAFHNSRNKSWDLDDEHEFCSVLQRDNPSPYQLMSVHVYGDSAGYFRQRKGDYLDILKTASQCARQSGQVLFVGEFGVQQNLPAGLDAEKAQFARLLKGVQDSAAALAALWVFDFPFQKGSWNVNVDEGEYQLKMIQAANEALRSSGQAPQCKKRPQVCKAP